MANPIFTITMKDGGVMQGELYPEIAAQKLRPIAEANGWGDVWTTHTLGEDE